MARHHHHLTSSPSTPAEAPPVEPTGPQTFAHVVMGGHITPRTAPPGNVVRKDGASKAQDAFMAVASSGDRIQPPPAVRYPEDYSFARDAMRLQKHDDLVAQSAPALAADVLRRRKERDANLGQPSPAGTPSEKRGSWWSRVRDRLARLAGNK
jgi:hypothetical protein